MPSFETQEIASLQVWAARGPLSTILATLTAFTEMPSCDSSVQTYRSFSDASHLFQSDRCHIQRIFGPQIVAKQFKRQITVVANRRELITIKAQINRAVARHYPIRVLLSCRIRFRRSIVK